MTGLRLALAAILLFPLAAAAAAQPHRAPAWQVDWGDQYCVLIRLPDRATPYVIALRALPGGDYSDLFLVPRGEGHPPARIDSVALAPSGQSFEVHSLDVEARVPGASVYGRLPPDFWTAFAGSETLELSHGDRVVSRIHLSESAAAGTALRQCISDAMREWGFDEAAWRALSRHPRALNALGIGDQDYPREAIRQNLQGRVVVRLNISAEGRATACAPVASSHTPVIDAAACNAALRRGRFRPALNAAGEPTAAQYVTTVSFLMSP